MGRLSLQQYRELLPPEKRSLTDDELSVLVADLRSMARTTAEVFRAATPAQRSDLLLSEEPMDSALADQAEALAEIGISAEAAYRLASLNADIQREVR
jgi:hypothetical protein